MARLAWSAHGAVSVVPGGAGTCAYTARCAWAANGPVAVKACIAGAHQRVGNAAKRARQAGLGRICIAGLLAGVADLSVPVVAGETGACHIARAAPRA